MAFSASGFIFTNHCVETSGSTDGLAALALADAERVVFDLFEQPELLQIGDHALARFEAIEAGVRAGRGGHAGRFRRSP